MGTFLFLNFCSLVKVSILTLEQIFSPPGVTLNKLPILSEHSLCICQMEK